MRIAIAATGDASVRGGAELLVTNLGAALAAAGHAVEVITLPFRYEPKTALTGLAQLWRLMNVGPDRADLVIATKFPTYYVRAPRKVLWLFHQHRALYDCFGREELSPFSPSSEEDLRVRDTVRAWDDERIAECAPRFAISATVARRLKDFNGLDAEVLYPPPPDAERFAPGQMGDYVFLPSRLEVNKRPWLLPEVLAHCRSPVRGVLAGAGPQEARVRQVARRLGVADRLELRGHVSAEERLRLYAGALAVFSPPYDEDLGFVTLEAFLAEKPVVTFQDSGGPTEFVQSGVNGAIAGTPAEAATAIDAYWADRARARAHGAAGRQTYRERIPGWEEISRRLTGAPPPPRSPRP